MLSTLDIISHHYAFHFTPKGLMPMKITDFLLYTHNFPLSINAGLRLHSQQKRIDKEVYIILGVSHVYNGREHIIKKKTLTFQ